MVEPTKTLHFPHNELLRRRALWALAAVLLVLLLGVWPYQHWDFEQRSSLFGGIIRKANQDAEWWFCLFTPFIVAWLVWRMRAKLSVMPMHGHWIGIPVLILGMVFYWFGFKVDTAYPGYLSAQIITLGVILAIGGMSWFKQLFFPWAFLVFTWPMLPLENLLAVPLRHLTAQASSVLLNLIGVDVVREGTGLHSAADVARGLARGQLFQLDVEEPCSGIRSLFSLLMISALYGWLSLKNWLPRGLLFASAIPLAMIGNMVRMVLLALGSLWFGTEFAVGRNIDGQQEMSFFHSMAGFAVFGVALTGMFAVCTQLERRMDRRKPVIGSAEVDVRSAGVSWLPFAVLILILGGGLAVCMMSDSSYQVAPAGIRAEMPSFLGKYVSTDQPMTSREQTILAEDVKIERRLFTKPDRVILASAVLSGAEKRSLHPPDVCLPAQGWKIGSSTPITIDIGTGRELTATLMNMYREVENESGQKMRIKALSLFWYQGSDGATAASYQGHVIKTYTDAFIKNINHRWALLMFFVPIQSTMGGLDDAYSEIAALEDTKAFIKDLVPGMLVK
ncbi:MAG: exosortase/archaeosortase family protein [Verrucomicrobia bacterium]|nr:exosortase/archaeosortase family protein [Verrucomicrobiota bacterium]